MIYEFKGVIPVIHESSFIHPQAAVTGNVIIGKNVYVGPGAAIRGDWGEIIIEDGCNVQENCTIHMFPGKSMVLKAGAHIGHGAIIHGANIGANCLVGMNTVIMDDVNVGDECIIGALSFIKAGMEIPKRKMVVGNPAVIFIAGIGAGVLANTRSKMAAMGHSDRGLLPLCRSPTYACAPQTASARSRL